MVIQARRETQEPTMSPADIERFTECAGEFYTHINVLEERNCKARPGGRQKRLSDQSASSTGPKVVWVNLNWSFFPILGWGIPCSSISIVFNNASNFIQATLRCGLVYTSSPYAVLLLTSKSTWIWSELESNARQLKSKRQMNLPSPPVANQPDLLNKSSCQSARKSLLKHLLR